VFKIIKFAAVLCIVTALLHGLGWPLCAAEATPLLGDAPHRDFLTLGLTDVRFWQDFSGQSEVSSALRYKLGVVLWDDYLEGVTWALCEQLRRRGRACGVQTYNPSRQYVLFAAIKAFFVLNRSRIAIVEDTFFIISDDKQQAVVPVLLAQKCGELVLLQCVVPAYVDVVSQKDFAVVYNDLREDTSGSRTCCVWSWGKRLLCCV
jgi:hypothetical protein